jgi:hypothetical protein
MHARQPNMTRRVGLAVAFSLAIVAAAQPATSSDATGGISAGALYGLVLTWVGFVIGFLNLRRGMRADAQKAINASAQQLINAEVDRVAPMYVPKNEYRSDHRLYEKLYDERHADVLRRIERLEDRAMSTGRTG